MNRRLLSLLAAVSFATFLLLAAVFLGAAYYSGEKTVTGMSKEIHAGYLREIVYNYRNELLSGNYRFFRNEIASLMDHEVFSDYALIQGGRQVEASEHFEEHLSQPGYLQIVVPVWFDEARTQSWGSVNLLVNEKRPDRLAAALREGLLFLLGFTLLASTSLAALYFALWNRLNIALSREVAAVFGGRNGPVRGLAGLLWRPTLDRLQRLKSSRDELARHAAETEKQGAQVAIARQVAHDIRSPLAALHLVSSQMDELEEDKRLLIRHAVQRIRDIANDLDARGRALTEEAEAPELVLLPALLDLVVSEKRMQYRARVGLRLEADIRHGYGIFASMHAAGIRRALSNLIDNAVEALPPTGGRVRVRLAQSRGRARIAVHDNGRGIPAERIPRLGELGLSFRANGSGLGLHQARKAVLSSAGLFSLRSRLGFGTCVTLAFPLRAPPPWFAAHLELAPGTQVVAIDDDPSIHELWKRRFARGSCVSFASLAEATLWLGTEPEARKRLFLVDHDFSGEAENGLDFIERLGLGQASILVTSRFEEALVQARCAKMGVRMLPKALASSVPIQVR